MSTHTSDTTTTTRLRSMLLELARRQDNLAADELAAVPYWSPCPSSVLPQNQKHLLDTFTFGSPLRDGACVLDADHQVGYIRREFGTRRSPDSAYWDGWSSVTPRRDAHTLSGKVMCGSLVQLIGCAT